MSGALKRTSADRRKAGETAPGPSGGRGDAGGELAAARRHAELLAAALDCVADPVYVKDAGLRYVAVNRAYAQRWGSEPEAMIGRRSADFAAEADAARFEASERAVLDNGEPFEAVEECDQGSADRSQIVRKRRLRLSASEPVLVGVVADVSENRRREREAQEARRQLERVIDSLPAGVIIFGPDDRLVLANRLIQELLPDIAGKWAPGTHLRDALLEGRRHGYFASSGDAETDRLYATDAEGWLERYFELYRRPHAVWERKHPDGRWFQVFDTRTPEGIFIGVRLEITELKRREEQLKQTLRENELFQSLIDNVPVSIYAKRPDLRLTYVNKGWCELTGCSREEAIGRTDVELFGPQGEAFREGDLEVLHGGEARMIEETSLGADGRLRHQIARKGVMRASDGSVYLIGSTTEITELKAREGEVQEARRLADKVKGEFLASMSREIRTPMNGVLGMAELLTRTELDARQRAFVDIIVKSGNALLTSLNDILDFSRIDAGQMALEAAPFDLGQAIGDVTALLSARAREKDLELAVRLDPSLARRFVGDAGRFRQVVTNLVGNAVKFTEVGRITVEVSGEALPEAGGAQRTRLTVSVEDTGIGIPADKLDLVFDKFSQVGASPARRHEGTGLGLAISARLVALMGGSIDVRSTEGRGSTFSFTVTLADADEAARPAPARTPAALPPGVRVLVVDADPASRAALLEQARSWGADACAACNGTEALGVLAGAAALGVAVDCAILDGRMPEMAAGALADRIRAVPSIAQTPLVLLAAGDQVAGPEGAGAFAARLAGPASPELLREAVASLLAARRLAAAPAAEAEPVPAVPSRVADKEAERGPHRIDVLVAEDNEVNQLVFTQILSGTPYAFQIVGNGRLACEAFRDMNPRLILMDVSMPEMDGPEACAAIRRMGEAEGVRVPVVGVGAQGPRDEADRCRRAGMDGYLPKPIHPRALREMLDRWLGKPELQPAEAR